MNIDREFAKGFGLSLYICNTFSLHAGTCFSFLGRHVKCRQIYIEYFPLVKGFRIPESGNFCLWAFSETVKKISEITYTA